MIKEILIHRLKEEFNPMVLEVEDLSHLHKGHVGYRPEGETHFKVRLVSPAFEGKTRLERHRMVHGALGEAIKEIHALELVLKSPTEYNIWKKAMNPLES